MADEKKGAIVVTRASKTIALPPCQMGYAHLVTPTSYQGGPEKYELDAHFTPAGLVALKAIMEEKVIGAGVEEVHKLAKEKGGAVKPAIPAEEWLANSLKDPKPKGRVQLPFIKIRAPANRKLKSGEEVSIHMACWGADDTLLDFAALRLAQGSIIQPIVYPNMFASKAAFWVPQPALKLVGIRVLKAVQYGTAGAPAPETADDEAIKAVMGGDFQIDDLAAYAVGNSEGPTHDDPHHEEEQDPASLAKGMF